MAVTPVDQNLYIHLAPGLIIGKQPYLDHSDFGFASDSQNSCYPVEAIELVAPLVDQEVVIGTTPAPTYSIPFPSQCEGEPISAEVSVDDSLTLPAYVQYTVSGSNLDFTFTTSTETPQSVAVKVTFKIQNYPWITAMGTFVLKLTDPTSQTGVRQNPGWCPTKIFLRRLQPYGYSISLHSADFDTTTMDVLLCGTANTPPYSTGTSVSNEFVAAYNQNTILHYSVHWEGNGVNFVTCAFGSPGYTYAMRSIVYGTRNANVVMKFSHPTGTLVTQKMFDIHLKGYGLYFNSGHLYFFGGYKEMPGG